MVWVVALRAPALKRIALMMRRIPDRMYVPEIMRRRPMVSNRCPIVRGPMRLPRAKNMK